MTVSSTKRLRLDIDKEAIGGIGNALVKFYNLRTPATPVDTFTIQETQKSDIDAIGEFFSQTNRLSLPAFIYRRRTVAPAADYLNSYILQHEGLRLGYTKDRLHVITIYPTKVVFSLEITLLTQDWDVLDHFIKVGMMYGKQELMLGDVELTDPVYKFPVRGKFADSFDYPEFSTQNDAFKGFALTTNLDLSTYICDLVYVPTVGQVTIQPVFTGIRDFDNKALALSDSNSVNNTDTEPLLDPKLCFTVNVRPSIVNPADRN
jgi:hypothetical protein